MTHPEDIKQIRENYLKDQAGHIDEDDVSDVIENEKKIDDKMKRSSRLKKYAELGKLMFDMLKDYRKGTYRKVPWLTISAIAFSLLYVLNPLDIVPDFIPGLGLVDDLSVFTLALRLVTTDLDLYLDWKLEKEE